MNDKMRPPDVERADSMPKEGTIPGFDAGWNAHRAGLDRESIKVFAGLGVRDWLNWCLLGWDARAKMVELSDEA